jgi:hypothetical protein
MSGVSEGQRTDAGRAKGVRGRRSSARRTIGRAAEESVHAAKPA